MPSVKCFSVFLAVAVAASASLVAAETIVVRSSGPSASSYPPGRKLPDSFTITLKTADSLTLLDGRGTRTLRGAGRFSGNATDVPTDRRTMLSTLLTTGRAPRGRTGTTRAVRDDSNGQSAKQPRSPNLWYVDIGESGTVCVTDAANLQLWRPTPGSPHDVSISGKGVATTTVRFDRNSAVATWPATVPLRDGAVFTLTETGAAKPVQVKIALLGSRPEDLEDTASTLIAKGCTAQLDVLIWLAALPDAAPES